MDQDTLLEVSSVIENKEDFMTRAKVIFKVLNEKLNNLSELINIRALTTLITINDLKKHNSNLQDDIMSRAIKYANRIIDHAHILSECETTEERLISCIAIVAEEETKDGEGGRYLDLEEEIEEIIEEFITKEIERVLWTVEGHSLIDMIRNEINKIITADKKVGLSVLISSLQNLQQDLKKALAKAKEKFTNLGAEKSRKQYENIVRNFAFQLGDKLKEIYQNQTKLTIARQRSENLFQSFRLRRANIKAAAMGKSKVSGREEVMQMLFGKDMPQLSSNKTILKEAKSLVKFGMALAPEGEITNKSFAKNILLQKDKPKAPSLG